MDWFERFSREAQQEAATGQVSDHKPRQKLQAVIDAVNVVLRPCGWQNLKWDYAANVIVAQHDVHGPLPVDSLSDGIRNIIGLIGDIAHRCVRLNPQFESLAAKKTPGIVLIDEVDMHLHPEWQQLVIPSLLEAFPSIQFIVTTHSPQVLTTVRKENIRIISQDDAGTWNVQTPQVSPLAQESADALAYVMNTHPRPQIPLLNDIQEYEQMARSGLSGSPVALEIKSRLDDAGFEFSEADKCLFDFLLKKKAQNMEG